MLLRFLHWLLITSVGEAAVIEIVLCTWYRTCYSYVGLADSISRKRLTRR